MKIMGTKRLAEERKNDEQAMVARQPINLTDLQLMAKSIAASGMFGVKTEDQAMALMLLCQAEGIHPVMALRRYHIIENKPAYRADALQGEFEREGAILWHERNETECSATFFRDKHKVDAAAVKRAKDRYKALAAKGSESEFAALGELTIIRTLKDAIDKRVAMTYNDKGESVLKKNWRQSPRQMLHARCLTEGVRAINPGLVAGIYTEDEVRDAIEADVVYENTASPGERANIVERNVKQATANAIAEITSTAHDEGRSDDSIPKVGMTDGVTGGRIVSVTNPEVTLDNYKDVVCHVGRAQGEVLGRKIGELHPNVIVWLARNWLPKLGPSATDEDFRLKTAIEFAIKNPKQGGDNNGNQRDRETRSAAERPATAASAERPAAATAATGHAAIGGTAADVQSEGNENKVAISTALIEKAKDLILTPDQFCRLLVAQGLLDEGKMLHEATLATLKYLETDEGWRVLKEAHEKEVKPQPIITPRYKKARRK
jgi:hypothetical protein